MSRARFPADHPSRRSFHSHHIPPEADRGWPPSSIVHNERMSEQESDLRTYYERLRGRKPETPHGHYSAVIGSVMPIDVKWELSAINDYSADLVTDRILTEEERRHIVAAKNEYAMVPGLNLTFSMNVDLQK